MTPRFHSPLITRYLGPRQKQLEVPLVYQARSGRVWTVPAGFVFDGASVPRFLWALYPPFGEAYEPAAALHDFFYKCAGCVVDDGHPMTRREADAYLREASEAVGFRGTGALVMYVGVRLGGWLPWRRHQRASLELARAA